MTDKCRQHPIIQGMEPSQEQLDPICSRGVDVVVTAGAGTGKTRTLVARYLSLLVEKVPLASISAITFTRKAAREMRNRIREEVRLYLTGDLSREERAYWTEIYQGLDAASIGTIHSLAGDILRRHPAEIGLDPRFDVLDEGEAALLISQAVDSALVWAGDDPQASRLFLDFGDWKLRSLIHRMMNQRLDILQHLEFSPEVIWENWRPYLIAPLHAFLDHPAVRENFQALLDLRRSGVLERAREAGDTLEPHLREVLYLWDQIQAASRRDDWAAVSCLLHPLRENLKQKGRKDNWKPADPKAIISQLQQLYDEMLQPIVKKGIDLVLDQRIAEEIIPALAAVFLKADQVFRSLKEQRSAQDYDDLEHKALVLLQEHLSVRQYWQNRVQALLVDEYQDTNSRQRDLLNHLNHPSGKLFIVGDGKQSIYRFRGADVSVFREEKRKISSRGMAFQLKTSYRAHKRLVKALNRLLRPVLGEEEDVPFIEPFSPLKPHRQEPAYDHDSPYVEFHLAVGSKSEGSLDRSAQGVASRVQALVDEQRNSRSKRNQFRYQDFAVLCRSSGSFSAYEDAFEQAGIPYLTISGKGFYDRPEIRDVLNALRALSDPRDDLALAGLLRSPVCGLSDLALLKVRAFQRKEELKDLLTAVRKIPEQELEQEYPKLQQVVAMVESLQQLVGRLTAAEVLKRFLDRTHYISSLQQAGMTRGAVNLKKLLDDAQVSGLVDIGTFLEFVDELQQAAVREGEAQAVASGAVQIMSVHQAKGLEFPVVVIGDAGRTAPRFQDLLIDERLGWLPPFSEERLNIEEGGNLARVKLTSAAYQLASAEEELREDAESNRLLYVAATRAEERLLISGTVRGISRDGTLHSPQGWLKKLTEPLGFGEMQFDYDDEGGSIHRFSLSSGEISAAGFLYEPEINLIQQTATQILAEEDQPPEDISMLEPVGVSVPDEKRVREINIWPIAPESPPPWLVGLLVHRALQEWRFPDHSRDFQRWAAIWLRTKGLSSRSDILSAVRDAERYLTRFQASDLYQMMANSEKIFHEVPFSWKRNQGEIKTGVIDALFHRREAWVMVEFKTDYYASRNILLKKIREDGYHQQVEEYLAAVEALLGARPQPVLCLLNVAGKTVLIDDQW